MLQELTERIDTIGRMTARLQEQVDRLIEVLTEETQETEEKEEQPKTNIAQRRKEE